MLMRAVDGEWTGIIGVAGWETYMAVSMGLPVVELVPSDRPRRWMSKWGSKSYYAVGEGPTMFNGVRSAMAAIERSR